MYRAMSSPAAWNTGNACSTSADSSSAAPSGSRPRRNTPPWTSPQSSPTRSPAAARSLGKASLAGARRRPCPSRTVLRRAHVSRVRSSSAGGHERGGALEQARRGAVVRASCARSTGGRQAPPRSRGQGAVVGRPQLGAVAAGLFEVVPEELVQLDELGRRARSSQDAKRWWRSARVAFGSAS